MNNVVAQKELDDLLNAGSSQPRPQIDLSLADKELDILSSQEQALEPEPLSGIHDFSSIQKPTDLPPISESFVPPKVLPEEIKPNLNQEQFKVDPRILEFLNRLIGAEGNFSIRKSLKSIKFDLEYAHSIEKVEEVLDKAKSTISDKQYETLLGFLDNREKVLETIPTGDPNVLPLHEDVSDPSPEPGVPGPSNVETSAPTPDLAPAPAETSAPVPSVDEVAEELRGTEEPDLGPEVLGPEMIEQDINTELNNARSEYATQYVAWRNMVREKKNWFAKRMSDFGIEKQMPEAERPQELRDAEDAYIEAKRKKVEAERVEKGFLFYGESLDLSDEERDVFFKQINESRPPLEKGIVLKSMETWAKWPMPARVALTTTLMTGVGMTFGFVAVAGVGATLAYKGARGVMGATLGQLAGAVTGQKQDDELHDKRVLANRDYIQEMDDDLSNFAEQEKRRARFFEEEENQRKRNLLKKIMVTTVVGGATNLFTDLAAGLTFGHVPGGIHNSGAGRPNEVVGMGNQRVGVGRPFDGVSRPRAQVATPETQQAPAVIVDQPKPSSMLEASKSPTVLESTRTLEQAEVPSVGVPKPSVEAVVAPKPSVTEVVEATTVEVKVPASSDGALQTIHNLKAEIIRKYGENIPPKIKAELMDRPSVEIAKEHGFYNPNTPEADNTLIYKGDSFGVDESGHLIYEHGGKIDQAFSAKTGGIKSFEGVGGEVVTPKVSPETPGVHVESADVVADKLLGPKPSIVSEQKNVFDGVFDRSLEPKSVSVGLHDELIFKPKNLSEVVDKIRPSDPTVIAIGDRGIVNIIKNGADRVVGFRAVTKVDDGYLLGDAIEIAHERSFGSGNMLMLDDKFQDGPQYQDIRTAFVEIFKENTSVEQLGETPTEVPFEGGALFIVQNPKSGLVNVFLNGKEIATGLLADKNIKIHYDPALPKSGWFFADNVYERAFAQAEKVLKAVRGKK